MVTLEAVADRLPPWGSPIPLVVLELDVRGLVLGDDVGEVGGEADAVVPLVFEGGDSLIVEGGEEGVVVDGVAVVAGKLRGNPVPVRDVAGVPEAVIGLPEEEIGTPLVGELMEELVAKDELIVKKVEVVEVEERTSGDDVEAEDVEDVEDVEKVEKVEKVEESEGVKLRNKVSKWRPITHERLTMGES